MTEEVQDKLGTQAAKDELAKGMRAFKAFENAHKVLARLESLEQDVSETEKRLSSLKAEEFSFIAVKDSAAVEAEAILKEANQYASTTKMSAKIAADNIVNEAKKAASTLVSSAKLEVATHLEKSNALNAENDQVQAVLTFSKAELSQIKEAVAQHKAALKKFVG